MSGRIYFYFVSLNLNIRYALGIVLGVENLRKILFLFLRGLSFVGGGRYASRYT